MRHGPTHEKAFVGWRDVPADLSDTAQIERVRLHLPHDAVIVSSDLCRASDTADAISKGQNRLPDAPLLREFNFGDWDGMGFDAVAARDPEISRAFWENPGAPSPPNGESWDMLCDRVSGFVDGLSKQAGIENVIAVAHIGVIMTQIGRSNGFTPKSAIGHKIDNLSVTALHLDGAEWRAGRINHNP